MRELPAVVEHHLRAEADDNAHRTAGTFGGAESGGRPVEPNGETKPTRFTDKLAARQDALWSRP